MRGLLILALLALIASLAGASPLEDIQAAAKNLDSSERGQQIISLSSGMNVTQEGNATVAFQKNEEVEFISASKMTNLTDDH